MRLRCGRDGFAPDTAPDQTNGAVAILALLDSRQDGATSFCFSESARAAAISSDPFSAVSFSVDERERGRRHQTADHHDRQGCRISASGQVAKRNGTFAAIRRLRLIDEADQIAPTHIAEHGRETLAVFADHLDRPSSTTISATCESSTVPRLGITTGTRAESAADARWPSSSRMISGVRTCPSRTMPRLRPSTQTRSASCTCSAFQAEPPGLAASDLDQRYRIPALRNAKTEPGASRIRAAISRASRLSVGMSSPNTFTTTPRARR
jgi:hypothetical protein